MTNLKELFGNAPALPSTVKVKISTRHATEDTVSVGLWFGLGTTLDGLKVTPVGNIADGLQLTFSEHGSIQGNMSKGAFHFGFSTKYAGAINSLMYPVNTEMVLGADGNYRIPPIADECIAIRPKQKSRKDTALPKRTDVQETADLLKECFSILAQDPTILITYDGRAFDTTQLSIVQNTPL